MAIIDDRQRSCMPVPSDQLPQNLDHNSDKTLMMDAPHVPWKAAGHLRITLMNLCGYDSRMVDKFNEDGVLYATDLTALTREGLRCFIKDMHVDSYYPRPLIHFPYESTKHLIMMCEWCDWKLASTSRNLIKWTLING